MAPALAYGRHRGPPRRGARIAAVAVTLFRNAAGQWTLPMTLRPDSISHHPGQICFPGGGLERGETIEQAAMREFEEELGVRPAIQQRCGELSTQFVYASNHLVHPVVLVIDSPNAPWRPDPAEVAQVIEFPLAALFRPDTRIDTSQRRALMGPQGPVGEVVFRAPALQCRSRPIWGATAMILDELQRRLQLAPALHVGEEAAAKPAKLVDSDSTLSREGAAN